MYFLFQGITISIEIYIIDTTDILAEVLGLLGVAMDHMVILLDMCTASQEGSIITHHTYSWIIPPYICISTVSYVISLF